jgi:hypothetical protein
LLPGALLAAIVIPQGPESGAGNIYLLLAGLLNSLLVAFPVMWTALVRDHPRKDQFITQNFDLLTGEAVPQNGSVALPAWDVAVIEEGVH